MNKILYFFLIFNSLASSSGEENLLQDEEGIFEDIKKYYENHPKTFIIGTIASFFVIVSIFILYITNKEEEKEVKKPVEPKSKLQGTPIKEPSYLHYYIVTAVIIVVILMYLPSIITLFKNFYSDVSEVISAPVKKNASAKTFEEPPLPSISPFPSENEITPEISNNDTNPFENMPINQTSTLMIIIQTILSLIVPVAFYVMVCNNIFLNCKKLQNVLDMFSIKITKENDPENKYTSSVFLSIYFVYVYYCILLIIDIFFIDLLNIWVLIVLFIVNFIINIIQAEKENELQEAMPENNEEQQAPLLKKQDEGKKLQINFIFNSFIFVCFVVFFVQYFSYTLCILFYTSNIFLILSLLSTFKNVQDIKNNDVKNIVIFFKNTYNAQINFFSFLFFTFMTYIFALLLYIPFLINIILLIVSFITFITENPSEQKVEIKKSNIKSEEKKLTVTDEKTNLTATIKSNLTKNLIVFYPYYLFYNTINSLLNLKNFKEPDAQLPQQEIEI